MNSGHIHPYNIMLVINLLISIIYIIIVLIKQGQIYGLKNRYLSFLRANVSIFFVLDIIFDYKI